MGVCRALEGDTRWGKGRGLVPMAAQKVSRQRLLDRLLLCQPFQALLRNPAPVPVCPGQLPVHGPGGVGVVVEVDGVGRGALLQ